MPAWIVQWKANVPAVVNIRVCEPLAKFGMSPVPSPASAAALAVASFQTTLCMTPEAFCHVTVEPFVNVRVVGVKVVEVMQNVPAGHTPPVVPMMLLPPHDMAIKTRIRAPNRIENFRILPPTQVHSDSPSASDIAPSKHRYA